MRKEEILDIIQKNYNLFKGTNEAELFASEEIFSLHIIETKELQQQLEYAENGHLAIQKDCDELFLKLAESESQHTITLEKLKLSHTNCLDFEKQLAEKKKELSIKLTDYCHKCGDGCCTNYGNITEVNGEELPCHNQDAETILKQVLEHLGYKVNIVTEKDY